MHSLIYKKNIAKSQKYSPAHTDIRNTQTNTQALRYIDKYKLTHRQEYKHIHT